MDIHIVAWLRRWYETLKCFLKFTFPHFVRDTINWRFIRGLGELQILTRASYIMIVFVPIIASMWPAVRSFVNDYNRIIEHTQAATDKVYAKIQTIKEDTHDKIEEIAKGTPQAESTLKSAAGKIERVAEKLEDDVRKIRLSYTHWYLNSQNLPWTWGALFFAAIFVVTGHLIYQTRAPEVVRRYTLDDYVRAQRADHLSQESPIAISDAKEATRSLFGIRQYRERFVQAESVVMQWVQGHGDLRTLSVDRFLDAIETIELHNLHLRRIPQFDNDEGARLLRRQLLEFKDLRNRFDAIEPKEKVSIIEKGAQIHYLLEARKNRAALAVALMLYLAGLCLIVRVIILQSELVIQMTNWKSISEVLNFQ